MNRIKWWAILCLTALSLMSCSADTPVDTPSAQQSAAADTEAAEQSASAAKDEKAQWTVMMYLCGTDLETDGAMATYNLVELNKTVPNDQVNVVFQTGGTRQWHTDEEIGLEIDETQLQRFQFDKEGYKLVDEQPLANMASAETLTEFVKWSAEAYPAEKYLLVLWDHGGGSLNGLIMDELHNEAILQLDQLEISLQNAGVPLEAVLMDTCLMATLETAQAVQPSAKYLIAAQEVVPGYGSAYQTWMQFLYDTPDCDGARLGKEVCNSVQQKYAELGMLSASRSLTFSVIDLSKIDAVSGAFDQMFLEVGSLLAEPENFFVFAYHAQKAQHFHYETMVDLADLASRTKNISLSNETASAVIEAVSDAVVYNLKGDQRSYATGISFYYKPAAPYWDLDHYARVSKSAPYLAFLDATSMQWAAPEWVYEETEGLPDVTYNDYVVETAVSLTEDGQPKLTITNAPSAVTAVNTILYQYEQDTDTWLRLGKDADVMGDFDKGIFYGSFPEEWGTFNDHLIQMDLVEETENYVLYSIPFQFVLPDMDPVAREFRMGYEFNEEEESETQEDSENSESADPSEISSQVSDLDVLPEGTMNFYGVWDLDSADSVQLPSRNVVDISYYYDNPIQVMRERLQLPDKELGMAASETFILSSDLDWSPQPLPKGKYLLMFDVTDVLGNEIQTDPIFIDWDGKTAVFSGADVETEVAEEETETDESAA